MRLILLTILTMCAFAANSVLTRAAVDGGHLDAMSFSVVRVAAGAAILGAISMWRGISLPLLRKVRLPGAISLTAYMIGFSLAYLTLDAGLGALILFGVTQITMFAHSSVTGQPPTMRQLSGAGLAFAGLVLVLWPGPESVTDPLGAVFMVIAGLGWAVYSIIGRREADPLAATGASFILCLPIMLLTLIGHQISGSVVGFALAVVSGAVMSGLGYALWYSVLTQMRGTTAAVVQLSVPVIAIVAGALLLGEAVQPIVLVAAALVLGGIGWAVTAKR